MDFYKENCANVLSCPSILYILITRSQSCFWQSFQSLPWRTTAFSLLLSLLFNLFLATKYWPFDWFKQKNLKKWTSVVLTHNTQLTKEHILNISRHFVNCLLLKRHIRSSHFFFGAFMKTQFDRHGRYFCAFTQKLDFYFSKWDKLNLECLKLLFKTAKVEFSKVYYVLINTVSGMFSDLVFAE